MNMLAALYYFLPAYFACMAPVYISKLNICKKPLDFSREFGGRRILGDNKTIQGFVFAVILGTLVYFVQQQLYSRGIFLSLALINYSQYGLALGFLLAFGAILGDAIKSFFKRQLGIAPGRPWVPFDQVDYSTFALLFSFMIFVPDVVTIIFLWLFSGALSLLTHYAGYLLGLSKDKV